MARLWIAKPAEHRRGESSELHQPVQRSDVRVHDHQPDQTDGNRGDNHRREDQCAENGRAAPYASVEDRGKKRPEADLRRDRAEDDDQVIAERKPEHRIVSGAQVVVEPGEAPVGRGQAEGKERADHGQHDRDQDEDCEQNERRRKHQHVAAKRRAPPTTDGRRRGCHGGRILRNVGRHARSGAVLTGPPGPRDSVEAREGGASPQTATNAVRSYSSGRATCPASSLLRGRPRGCRPWPLAASSCH